MTSHKFQHNGSWEERMLSPSAQNYCHEWPICNRNVPNISLMININTKSRTACQRYKHNSRIKYTHKYFRDSLILNLSHDVILCQWRKNSSSWAAIKALGASLSSSDHITLSSEIVSLLVLQPPDWLLVKTAIYIRDKQRHHGCYICR